MKDTNKPIAPDQASNPSNTPAKTDVSAETTSPAVASVQALSHGDIGKRPEQILAELLTILKLEKIEENIFRGTNINLGMKTVFGGQVLGQALSAASQTVPPDRHAHSLHAYFMRHGDPTIPIVYTVDCIRDGRSFTTRRVLAVQNGRAIFSMAVSFHIEEPGFEHFDAMPRVPEPEGIASERELAARATTPLPERILNRVLSGFPLEFRHALPTEPFPRQKMPPHKYVWVRTTGPLPDDPALQRYVLSFASDFYLVITSLFPHAHTIWEKEIQAASLDHAMWFHREFRCRRLAALCH